MRQQISQVRALCSLLGHWPTISLAIAGFGSTFGCVSCANVSEPSLPRPTVMPSAAVEVGITPDLNASKQSFSLPTGMPSAAFDSGISPDSHLSMQPLYQPSVMPSAAFDLGISTDANTSMYPFSQPSQLPSATLDLGSLPDSNTSMQSPYKPTVIPSANLGSGISPDSNTSMQSLSQPTTMPSDALKFSMPPFAIASKPSVPPQNAMLPSALKLNFTSPAASPTSPWSYNPTPSVLTVSPVTEHTYLPSYDATSGRSSGSESNDHHTEIPTLMPSIYRPMGAPSNWRPVHQTTSIPSMSIQSVAPSPTASKAPSNYNTTDSLNMFQSPTVSTSPPTSSSPSIASPPEPTETLQKYGPTLTNVSEWLSRPTTAPSAAFQTDILQDSNASTQPLSQPTAMPSAAPKFSMPPVATSPKPSIPQQTVVPSTALKVNSTPLASAPASPWSYTPTRSILSRSPMNEQTFVPTLNATLAQSSESESNSHHTEIPTLMPSMFRSTSTPSNWRPVHRMTSTPSMSIQNSTPSPISASTAPSNYNTVESPHIIQSPSGSRQHDLSSSPSAPSPSGTQTYGPTTMSTSQQSLSRPTRIPSAAFQSGVLPDANNSMQPLYYPTIIPSSALEVSMPPYSNTSKPSVLHSTAMPPKFELNSTAPTAAPTSSWSYYPTRSILSRSPSSEHTFVPSLNATSSRASESESNGHHTEVPTMIPSMQRSTGPPTVSQTTSIPSNSIQSVAPSRTSALYPTTNYNATEKPHTFQSPSGSSSRDPSSSFSTTLPTSRPPAILPKYSPTTMPPSEEGQAKLPSTRSPAVSPSFSLTYEPSSIPTKPPSRCPAYQPTTYVPTQLTYNPSSLPTTRPSALPSGADPTVTVPETSQPHSGNAAPFTGPTTVDSTGSKVPSTQPYPQWPSDIPTLLIPSSNHPAASPHINLVSNPSAVPLAEPTEGQHSVPSACPKNSPTYTMNPTSAYRSQIIASSSLTLIGVITDIFGIEEARVFRTAVTDSVDIISNASDVTIISVSAQRRRRRQRHLLNETSALGVNFFARLSAIGQSRSQLFDAYISQLSSAVTNGQLDMTLQMQAGETHLQGVYLDKTKSVLSIMEDSSWTEVTVVPSVSPTVKNTPDGTAQPDLYLAPTSEPSALPTAADGKSDGNGHFAEASVFVFVCAGVLCGLVCCCGLCWKFRHGWSKQPVRMFPRDEETPEMFNLKPNMTRLRTPHLKEPTFRTSSFCEELHEAWQEICQGDRHSSSRRARSRHAGRYFVE